MRPDDQDDETQEPSTRAGSDEGASVRGASNRATIKRVFREWNRQTKLLRQRHAEWRVNALRRRGYTNVFAKKDEDADQWVAWAPPDAAPNPVALNKANRLCERLVATLFVDPPVPDATPASDSPEDRDGAEFATRLLILNGSEAGLNTPLKAQQAVDLASTYDSGFIRYWVDRSGNGLRPAAVLAHPTAQTLDDAARDPATGTPWPESELVTRYITADDTLTDEPSEARQVPLPKLRSEVLSGLHIRLLPFTARDVWEADGVLVAAMVPLGRLKSAWPDAFQDLSPEQLKKIVQAQPEGADRLVPAAARRRYRADLNTGAVTDESPVFTLTYYHLACGGPTGLYPRGAYVVVAGDDGEEEGLVLESSDWVDPVTGDPLDLPVSQFKQWDLEDDTWGIGAMRKLGPANEARSYLQGATFEQADRALNRKVFVPITSTYQPKAAQAQFQTHIPINPGGHPEYEDVPDLPAGVGELYTAITAEMDDEISLQAPAQGQTDPSVESAIHARTLIEQSNVGLAGVRTNTLRGWLRCERIELQLCRAFFDVPQRVSWLNDDGIYKERHWSGADLASTKDVQLARGTFTQLSATAKAALAKEAQQLGILQPDELERILAAQVGGLLALQDNPIRARIRRQVSAWSDGPPEEGDADAGAPADPTAADAALRQAAAQIWAPLAMDEEPDVARTRHAELRRLMASTTYLRWPPAWRAPLDAEYLRMRQAAGIVTVFEQQAAAQAAQAAAAPPAPAPAGAPAPAPAPAASPPLSLV